MTEPTAPAATEVPAAEREFTFVYNGTTSYYDVHAAGCRHLHLYSAVYGRYAGHQVCGTIKATDAKAAKVAYETGNEGIYVGKISPCAK